MDFWNSADMATNLDTGLLDNGSETNKYLYLKLERGLSALNDHLELGLIWT